MATRKIRKPTPKPLIGRTTAISLGAAAIAIGGALLTILARGRTYAASAEHAAPDLALGKPHPGPDDRAPVAFRPDPGASVPAAEREALRPARLAPSLAASRTAH
jgi:hypothetical protein